ncbi:Ubiquitin interaction motif family protein [Brugia malayi]|uniref:26S proteasome non-ATPase regulatory subunit 4 n=2 Tax=Brugia TaxID=6278 RepID=A0A0K0J2P8_BRUMA|nr:Ubiquitin interaction motif family protein [Brugia malayi]CRZ22942.1 BMA-RPN-10 [Brugia malayi]VIO96925.1 Ubiquitin interaction motif family protein [Brugia malayi]
MVQESTMICVDNSEWMRNGDFAPTRLQCQQDAVNLVLQCKLRANPENAVGLIAMADTVEVLTTLTQENGKLFMKLHQVEPKGASNFINAIKVAHLALKHRQNRNHKMRIVVFVGSPIDHLNSAELTKLAKKLKKEKVQVDVICFGEADSTDSEIMGQFIETLNGKEGSGSNLVVVPASSSLTEALVSSPICRGEDGTAAPVVASGGGGFEFGIDPEDDPDLALALRVSLEEQRQRQRGGGTDDGELQPANTAGNDIMTMDPGAMTEEQQLEWALRMSMQEGTGAASSATLQTPSQNTITTGQSTTTTEMSAMETATAAPPKVNQSGTTEQMEVDDSASTQDATMTEDDQLGQLMSDPELLRQLLADLPGVDPNSQEVRDAVNSAAAAKEKKEDKDNQSTK